MPGFARGVVMVVAVAVPLARVFMGMPPSLAATWKRGMTAMVKRTLPQVPSASDKELGNEFTGVFTLTLRAFAHVGITVGGDGLKPALAAFAIELVEGHRGKHSIVGFLTKLWL
jgi:hypothetical protein